MQVREPGLKQLQRQQRSPKARISEVEHAWHNASPSAAQTKQSGGANHPIAASKTLML